MFKIEDEPLDDDYKTKVTNEMENITIDDINIFLKKVNDRDLIDFFKESIDELKSTFYSKFLFDDIDNNKLVKGFPVIYKELNLKNFYNIAKTLSHNTKDNKFELLPKKYSSLSEEEMTKMLFDAEENKIEDERFKLISSLRDWLTSLKIQLFELIDTKLLNSDEIKELQDLRESIESDYFSENIELLSSLVESGKELIVDLDMSKDVAKQDSDDFAAKLDF